MVAASFRSLTEMPMRRLHQEPPVTPSLSSASA
jgi:hypothetical protein